LTQVAKSRPLRCEEEPPEETRRLIAPSSHRRLVAAEGGERIIDQILMKLRSNQGEQAVFEGCTARKNVKKSGGLEQIRKGIRIVAASKRKKRGGRDLRTK